MIILFKTTIIAVSTLTLLFINVNVTNSQCTGYPVNWDGRKLTESAYRWTLSNANNVRRTDNTLIPEADIREDIRFSINKWLNAINAEGALLTIVEGGSVGTPINFRFEESLEEGICGAAAYPDIRLKRTEWYSQTAEGVDLKTTILHELGHIFLGGGHWGAGIMGLRECDQIKRHDLSQCEREIVLNTYNPKYIVIVKNNFGNGIGGGSIKVDGLQYDNIPQSGKEFTWRKYGPTHTITVVDSQDIPENGVNYRRIYQRWINNSSAILVTRPMLSFSPSANTQMYTAVFEKEFNITFQNNFIGANGGQIKVNGIIQNAPFTTKTLARNPPQSITSEAMYQVINRIENTFKFWTNKGV